MHTIKITPNLLFVYKQQIYQIAESNRKNRFGSVNRIEIFLARIGMLYSLPRLSPTPTPLSSTPHDHHSDVRIPHAKFG